MAIYGLIINGERTHITAEEQTPLLYVLRQLGLTGTRYGCGLEQCGSCRIIVNGQLEYACTKTVSEAADVNIETIEGLAEGNQLHIIQQSFLNNNAGQCGYCLSGIIMTAYHLLNQNPNPSRAEIQLSLVNNLCRCGAHNRIIRAIQQAGLLLAEKRKSS